MQRSINDNPHPELQRWLAVALEHRWPTADRPRIEGDALQIPHAYFHDHQCRELKSVEWVAVRTREQLANALGYEPLSD